MPRKRTTAPKGKGSSKKAKIAPRATVKDGFLKVIDPDTSDTAAMQVLQALDEHLRTKRIKDMIIAWCPKGLEESDTPGIRIINGNRFEMFVSAKDKETDAFEKLTQDLIDTHQPSESDEATEPKFPVFLNKSVEDIRTIVLNYAKKQAERDERIGPGTYAFDNFSLLINFSSCDEQFPHIDLLAPNVQCGLAITDKSPATVAFQTPHSIETVQDLKKHLWKDLPDEVAAAIENDPQCTRLLRQFGNALHPKEALVEQKIPRLLQRGALLCLPGSQMHSGPKCTRSRCVLFFSGWQKDSAIVSYDPDTQYFGPLLMADFLMQLFHQLSVEGRKYFVHKLGGVISSYKNLYRHLDDEAMRKFCNALGWAQYGTGGKEELIQQFCEGKGIVPKFMG